MFLFFETSNTAEYLDIFSLFKFFQEKNIPSVFFANIINKEKYINISNCHFLDYLSFNQLNFLHSFSSTLSKGKYAFFSYSIPQVREVLKKLDIPTVFVQHGVIFLKESIFINYLKPEIFDTIIVTSDIEKSILLNYGWDESQILPAGLPRSDKLPQTHSEKNKIIFVFFTWRLSFEKLSLNEVISSPYWKKINSLVSALQEKYQKNNIQIAFASHHQLAHLPIIKNPIIPVPTQNISEYVKKADLLITDYSSLAFDFFYQEKPVLFFNPDSGDDLLSSKDIFDRENFPSKKNFIPNTCDSIDHLFKEIDRYVKNNFNLEEEHKKTISQFFYSKGNNCQKIVDYFQKNS